VFPFGLVPTGRVKSKAEAVRAALWWKFSSRAECLHDDQMSNPAMRTERRRWCDFGGRGREVGGRVPGVGAGRHIGFDQGSCLLTRHLSAGTGQSVIAHFGKTRREDVVHKTADKFLGAESHALKLLGPVVAIAKGDLRYRCSRRLTRGSRPYRY